MARLRGIQDLMFPLQEHPVFAGIRTREGERRVPIPDRKAIFNGATGRVLGIVSRDCVVVTNEQALAWARQCCRTAFPQTHETEWQVHLVDAPSTASYCHIDLTHNSCAVDFTLVPAKDRPQVFGPFVRVTNTYNTLRALAFDIGFHRKVCKNGLIPPETVVQFRFSHDRKALRSISFRDRRAETRTIGALISTIRFASRRMPDSRNAVSAAYLRCAPDSPTGGQRDGPNPARR